MGSKLDAALALAAEGFAVFPIRSGSKAPPLVYDWPAVATDNPVVLHDQMWHAWPDANIGIHTKGYVVIDVDVKKGGLDALQRFSDLDMLPATRRSHTPSGGQHIFYRLPDGHSGVPNSIGQLGSGLDIRSTGGYVVAPGSSTAAGAYAWLDVAQPIADAPDWLLTRLGQHGNRDDGADGVSRDVRDAAPAVVDRAVAYLSTRDPAIEGAGGDAHTYATACAVRDMGLSAKQAFEALDEWNSRCSPPWSQDDLWQKVLNAYRYAENEAGVRLASAADFPATVPNLSTIVPKSGMMRLDEFAGQNDGGAGYVIKGMLSRASYAEIYGAPGEGKTFTALDVSYHVAAGRDWMGCKVHGGPVLYLAYEGRGGLVKRARALRHKYGTDAVPLYIAPVSHNMREQAGRQAIGQLVAELPAKPALIVFDTFHKALIGGDENSAQDVGAFNLAVEALIEQTGACVAIIHHTGKDKSKGARGSSALVAAVDTEIQVDEGQVITHKQRDMEEAAPVGFKLQTVVVGIDSDGDEQTSCVVQPSTVTPVQRKLSGNARRGFDVLCSLSANNEPVYVEDWRVACNKEFGAAKSSFSDLKKALLAKGFVSIDAQDRATRRME